MAASREVIYLDRFNGGLNLSRQAQYLSATETPDCLNVDFDVRGGFSTRSGFVSKDEDALLLDSRFLGATYFGGDVVLIQNGVNLVEWDGTAATDTAVNITDNGAVNVYMATFADKAYFAGGLVATVLTMRSWDGTSLATLGNNFNDDYTAPANGNMPKAKLIASHKTHMFVADTVESGTRFPSRLRFSHLGFPEDWAADDYITVGDEDDGDPIVGLLSFADHLLIFKHTGIWGLYGYDRESWVLDRVAVGSGIRTQECVTASANLVYFFSTEGNVVTYDGSRLTVISEPIEHWVRAGNIDPNEHGDVMFGHDKLFLVTGTGPQLEESHLCFVWDIYTKTWTRYSPQIHSMMFWKRIANPDVQIFMFHNVDELFELDETSDVDVFAAGNTPFLAYYRTSWMTAGETATKKRWKRPRISAAANATMQINIQVFHNFNESAITRIHEVHIDVQGAGGLWGENWGTLIWGGDEEGYEFERLPSSGSAYTVQYLFTATAPTRWWVDSLAVPFRRKQVK